MSEYIWLIPLLPGFAALLNGIFGRWLKTKTAIIAITAMVLTFVISAGVFFESINTAKHEVNAASQKIAQHDNVNHHAPDINKSHEKFFKEIIIYRWITSGDLKINIGFQVDNLSIIMILFISFVGSLVFIYSTGYMKHHGKPDAGYERFFTCMSLFTFSMYILVLANNFVLMFVGWEGVGLCSYLLIGYYMDKNYAADAAKKAFIVNRVGDFGFLLASFIIYHKIGSLDFSTVFKHAPEVFAYSGAAITAATLLLFWGACGKSAQIPLYIWLPDAMAGPTPVSALIHAATMVTAGVYMVARCNILFMLAPISMDVVALVGVLTAFVAAFIGLTQRDIKRVLAYSTISQLGFMFLALGVGAFSAGIFHVFTHSFFKGCLFLCAGSVIHALAGEQDMFKMGGLKKKMPITTYTYLLSTLAIVGIPFWSGFFSKDEILWSALNKRYFFHYLLGIITALLTAVYMFRSLFLTFFGKSNISPDAEKHIHESPKNMTIPLILLAFCATFAGFLNIPEFFRFGDKITLWFHHYLSPVTDEGLNIVSRLSYADLEDGLPEICEALSAFVSILMGFIGLIIAYLIYIKQAPDYSYKISQRLKIIYSFSFNKIWWDDFCHYVFGKGTLILSAIVGIFDSLAIDGVVNGVGCFVRWLSEKIRKIQNGKTQDYALWILAGIVLLLFICVLSAFELENIVK